MPFIGKNYSFPWFFLAFMGNLLVYFRRKKWGIFCFIFKNMWNCAYSHDCFSKKLGEGGILDQTWAIWTTILYRYYFNISMLHPLGNGVINPLFHRIYGDFFDLCDSGLNYWFLWNILFFDFSWGLNALFSGAYHFFLNFLSFQTLDQGSKLLILLHNYIQFIATSQSFDLKYCGIWYVGNVGTESKNWGSNVPYFLEKIPWEHCRFLKNRQK